MSTHYFASSESFVEDGLALFFVEPDGRTTGVNLEPEQAVELADVLNRRYGGPPYENLDPRRVQALLVAARALSPHGAPADLLPLAEWLLIDAPANPA
jgi:hypothetical protein